MPLNVNNGAINSFESLLLKYKNVASHPQLSDKITDYLASIDEHGHTPSEEVIAAVLELAPTDPDAQVALDALVEYMQASQLTLAITSDEGGTTASLTVDENTTEVTTAVAYDPQNDPVTYSISGGADAALFQIDEVTGELSFIDAPDFEAPGDADTDNFYDVTVMAYDAVSGQTDSQAITVEVQDVVEATGPVIYDLNSGTDFTGITGVAENFVFDLSDTSDPDINITNFTVGEDRMVFTNTGGDMWNFLPILGWTAFSGTVGSTGVAEKWPFIGALDAGNFGGLSTLYFFDENGAPEDHTFIIDLFDSGDFSLSSDWIVPTETEALGDLASNDLFVFYADDLILA